MDFETPLFQVDDKEHSEKKSEETEELNIEDDQVTSEIKSGDTQEVNLEGTEAQGTGVQHAGAQSTDFQGTVR